MQHFQATLVLLAACAFAVSPLIATGFNGFEPDQFPAPQTDPPVQPAGYAFSIWLVIYVWLIAGAAFGLWRRAEDPAWTSMRWPLFISLAIGAGWLSVAQVSPIWAAVMIWMMLGGALWALVRAGGQDRFWLPAPIAVYAGWLTAASCVALALNLAGYGFVSAQVAALVMLVVALVIAATVVAARPGTPEYAGAVIWALIAVVVANASPPNLPVLILSILGILGLGFLAWRNRAA
ncbi:MAG: hypothetical protein AAFN80_09425 [Pseudomonadota bacterium]